MQLLCFFTNFVLNMKWFFSILSIYMLAVFLTPCTDMVDHNTLQSANHIGDSAEQDNHDHSETPDNCSPFCVCNCCGSASVTVFHWNAISFSETKIIELSKHSSPYQSKFIPRYFGKIWQPPKVNA